MKETDIAGMLEEGLGIKLPYPVKVTETEATYPIKPEVWDNWFPFAYMAFRKLAEKSKNTGKSIKSFATIGTGGGADALGALFAFDSLDSIILTDINENVVPAARENVEKYASPKGVKVIALEGNLCAPLREKEVKVDVLYENLPNIPDSGDIVEGHRRASRFKAGSLGILDEGAKSYLLQSHLAALIEAKGSLNKNGVVVCSIGGRVPYEKLVSLVQSAGYKFNELAAGLKRQTEPWEVFPGYAEVEKVHKVEFDFYLMKGAAGHLSRLGLKKPFTELNGEKLKQEIASYRINATEALRQYQKNPDVEIGHTVHMLGAVKVA